MQNCRALSDRLHRPTAIPVRLPGARLPQLGRRQFDRLGAAIPATYVIDRTGLVVLSYLDADHTTRLEPTEIIAALTYLRAAHSAQE